MKNNINIAGLLIIACLFFTNSCSSNNIKIDQLKSLEIKNKEFTTVNQEERLQKFKSSSFSTQFFGTFVPYGAIWFANIKGSKQSKEFNLQNQSPKLKEAISSILVEKYQMQYKRNTLITTNNSNKELSNIHKNYPYVANVSTSAEVRYMGYDDHLFVFNVYFSLIDTKTSKEISNITCEYKGDKESYHSKEYFFLSNAKNLKLELSKGVSECIEFFEKEI